MYAEHRRALRHCPEIILKSCSRFARVLLHRAQMARLEKQLHDAAKGSHPQRPRTWANVSQPASSEAPLVPRASTECSLPVVTNETERSVGRGGAPCNPEAGRTPSQADRTPNRSTVDVHHTTMRMALEKQQRGATMAMASDAYSVSCALDRQCLHLLRLCVHL